MGTRAAALKRWRRHGERQRMSNVMKARYRPKSVTKVARPSEVEAFVRLLAADDAVDVVECSPTFRRGPCWKVAAVDASGDCLLPRYERLAARTGLVLYDYFSKPLRSSEGITVAVVVGPRQ